MADITIKPGKFLQKKGSNVRYDLGWSENDFTTELKTKLENIASEAQVNVLEKIKLNGADLAIDADKRVDLGSLQAALTAGTGITIGTDNTISCSLDTTLYVVCPSGLPSAPATGNENKIHLVPTSVAGADADNGYLEYLWITVDGSSKFEKFGEFKTTVTPYTHPSHTAYSSGLYKITIDELGHVTAAVAVGNASLTADGLMSKEDKSKLEGIATGANKTTMAIDEANGIIYLDGIEEVAYTA